jgi:beta-xylosidase
MQVQNPIIRADMPDPDVLRVGDTCDMVSAAMFVMPGGPILKSKDPVHWETV